MIFSHVRRQFARLLDYTWKTPLLLAAVATGPFAALAAISWDHHPEMRFFHIAIFFGFVLAGILIFVLRHGTLMLTEDIDEIRGRKEVIDVLNQQLLDEHLVRVSDHLIAGAREFKVMAQQDAMMQLLVMLDSGRVDAERLSYETRADLKKMAGFADAQGNALTWVYADDEHHRFFRTYAILDHVRRRDAQGGWSAKAADPAWRRRLRTDALGPEFDHVRRVYESIAAEMTRRRNDASASSGALPN